MPTICAIAGSLRQASFNRALLRAAVELAPAGMELVVFDRLRDLPHYDGDLEAAGVPEPVAALRAAIGGADGLLIATPEYNYSIPGVLKNAIDWASRPASASVLAKKPCAIMGASGGPYGTVRGQLALRQSLLCTDTQVLVKPELMVPRAQDKFDAALNLVDEPTRLQLAKLLAALGEAIARR